MREHEYADFVVVGGGSCGCVLASRLSEDPSARVLLLEAGAGYRSIREVPTALVDPHRLPVGPGSRYGWTYPVELTSGRTTSITRGRVLGGSGAVNGAYFARATRADFEQWPAGWRYDDVLPYFTKSETDHDFGGPFHGSDGPIPVERRPWDRMHPLSSAFHAAALAAGFADDADKNAPDSIGVGRVPLNIAHGRRLSTALGYLLPVMERPNLRVEFGASVRRVVFSGDRAVAVDVDGGGGLRRVHAGHVVLCAGAVQTPHLLLNSGIGPADQLAAVGISTVVELPGVGSGFVDHPEVVLPYRFSEPSALRRPIPVLETVLNLDHLEIRPYTASFTDVIPGIGPTDPVVGVALMTPDSRGSLHLTGDDPAGPLRIRYNYLESGRDRAALREGVGLARSLLADVTRSGLIEAGHLADDGIESGLGTSLHMAGSCVMGVESDVRAVVDTQCRVFGTQGLSIVDTSVLPTVSRGPHATAVMVAERAAELLRAQCQ